ncbi:hypothetical protein D3C72_275690 [compost metagenome]
MMYRLLHITIVPILAPTPQNVIQKRMSDLGRDWMSYNAFCWLLWTNKSILTVSEMVMGDVNPGDQVLVMGVNATEVPNGRLPEWVWAWFNRPRNPFTGEVQTPAIPAPEALNLFDQSQDYFPLNDPGKAQF